MLKSFYNYKFQKNMSLKDSLKKIIAGLESRGEVKAVFGEPRKKGIVTLVPVALLDIKKSAAVQKTDLSFLGRIKNALGRFSGRKKSKPAGYIRIKNGQAEFLPLKAESRLNESQIMAPSIPPFGLGALLLMKLIMEEDERKKISGNA